jgi:hypothetical protein
MSSIKSLLSLFDAKEEWNEIYKKEVYFENELHTNKIILSIIQEAVRAYVEGEKFEIKLPKIDEKEKKRIIKNITSSPPKFMRTFITRGFEFINDKERKNYQQLYPFCDEKKCTFSHFSGGFSVFYSTLSLPVMKIYSNDNKSIDFTVDTDYDNTLFHGSVGNIPYIITSKSKNETQLILFISNVKKESRIIPIHYTPYSVCGANDYLFATCSNRIFRINILTGKNDMLYTFSHTSEKIKLSKKAKIFIFPGSRRLYVSDAGYIYIFLLTSTYEVKYLKKLHDSQREQTAVCIVELADGIKKDRIAVAAAGRSNIYIWNLFSECKEESVIEIIKGAPGCQSAVSRYSDEYFSVVNKFGVNFYSSNDYRLVQNLPFIISDSAQPGELFSLIKHQSSIIISSKKNFFIVL